MKSKIEHFFSIILFFIISSLPLSTMQAQIEITYDSAVFGCSFGDQETASFNCSFNGSLSSEVIGVSDLELFIFDPVNVVDGSFSFSHNIGAPTNELVEVIWTIETSDDASGCAQVATTISTFIQLDCQCYPTIQNFPVYHESCYQCADGSGQLLASGMQEPILYQWSNGATTSTIENLQPGTYNLTATGSNLEPCSITGSISIEPYECIKTQIEYGISQVQCHGDCDGIIDILGLENGTEITSILWSDGSTDMFREGLCPGFYSGTASTVDNCPYLIEVSIDQPEEFEAEIKDITHANGSELGSITITANGGTPPYFYYINQNGESLEHPPSESVIDNLESGCYEISVQDNNDCTVVEEDICIDNISSTQFLENSKFSIYPNPCRTHININRDVKFEILEINIFDILGEKQPVTIHNSCIYMDNLKSGVYIIDIVTGEGQWVEQFVKK